MAKIKPFKMYAVKWELEPVERGIDLTLWRSKSYLKKLVGSVALVRVEVRVIEDRKRTAKGKSGVQPTTGETK